MSGTGTVRAFDIDPGGAELAGFVVETVLYGVYLTLWIASTCILLDRHRLRRPVPTPVNKLIFAGSSAIFATVSAHWVLDAIRIWRGFIHAQSNGSLGTLLYFTRFGDGLNVARTGCVLLAGWLLDTFLVYRVYIIWEESLWHALPPTIGLVGLFVSAIMTVYQSSLLQATTEVYSSPAGRWITAAFSMSVATNVIASSLIAFRLATLSKAVKSLGGPRSRGGLKPVVKIVIESAVVYTLCCIVTLAAYLGRSGIITISADITSSVIGISFSLIIVRVGIDLSPQSYLPTSLPPLATTRQHRNRHTHTWSPTPPTTPDTPAHPGSFPYAADVDARRGVSAGAFDGRGFDGRGFEGGGYESRETLQPPLSAGGVHGVALPRRARADSDGAWTEGEEAGADPLGVKPGG